MFVWSLKTHKCVSKKKPNSPIYSFNQELISIMENKGLIHREIGNFFRCSSNSIKSNDELRSELETLVNFKRRLQDKYMQSKII